MSTFEVKIVEIAIEPHNNADALEIAQIKGYQSIVRKDQFQTGDRAVYIPEQSIVPEWILKRLGLWDEEKGKGKLAGKQGNRVKAVKLRGVLSQGLLYKVSRLPSDETLWGLELEDDLIAVQDGQEVSSELGIIKWEPPIPTHLSGEVANVYGYTLNYDIENVKNHPEVIDFLIENAVEVEITEKIHGTWCCIGFYPETIHSELFGDGNVIITSKGLSAKGLAFKNVPNNERNTYVRAFNNIFDTSHLNYGLDSAILETLKNVIDEAENLDYNLPIFFLGEIFGQGIQDLSYGFKENQFRLFDVFIGYPNGQGRYLFPNEMNQLREVFPKLSRVPVLYRGALTHDVIEEYTNGMDTLNGYNIREGIIIKPFYDHNLSFPDLKRVILKSVSEAYILRKNGTEHN